MSTAEDLAAVREQLAGLADRAERIAAAVEEFGKHVDLLDLVRVVRRHGFEEGRAERDPLAAEARARKARSEFKVLPGGKAETLERAPRMRKAATSARPRRTPGGAA